MKQTFNSTEQSATTAVAQDIFTRLAWLALLLILARFPAQAQISGSSAAAFDIISRTPVAEKENTLGVASNNAITSFRLARRNGKSQYSIASGGGGNISVDALSYIEYAPKANLYVVYGDSSQRHVVTKAYVNFYTGNGKLLKALGLVATWPFAAALSETGLFTMAGNKNQAGSNMSIALSQYDANGNKRWETSLPSAIPTKVFNAANGKYTAVVLFDSEKRSGSIQYYDAKGALVFTDTEHTSVSGIEFLPSGKVVVSIGSIWFLHDLAADYKLLASGKLPGNTVGKYPISAHPSRNVFFIVTASGSASGTGYRLQAFNGDNGALLAEGSFDGEPSWQSYRLAEVAADGTIRLLTSREVIKLKMK